MEITCQLEKRGKMPIGEVFSSSSLLSISLSTDSKGTEMTVIGLNEDVHINGNDVL